MILYLVVSGQFTSPTVTQLFYRQTKVAGTVLEENLFGLVEEETPEFSFYLEHAL